MIQSDYLRKIVEAVFNNPEPAPGVGKWVQRGRMKITNFRPDGEKTSKKDKFKISISSGDWPRFYYNGSSFPDKWEFMESFRWKNNTNNDAEVWARLASAELTNIDPKTGEEQKKRKYDNSAAEILNKEGYYTSLPYNKPVIIAEGYLDAFRIMLSDKAGEYCVFALTGASFTGGNSDNGSHAQTLKRNGVKAILSQTDAGILEPIRAAHSTR